MILWIAVLFVLNQSSCSVKDRDANSEKPQIVVLATKHTIREEDKRDVEIILERLKSYGPDLIATEQSPHYDLSSLKKYEPKYYKTFTTLREKYNYSSDMLLDSIRYYHRKADDDSIIHLAHLARLYYVLGDRSNYQFYIYRVREVAGKSSPDEAEKAVEIIGKDLYERVSKRVKNSEYGNIVFPLAGHMGITKMVPVDHQAKADSFVYWQKRHYEVLISKHSRSGYDSIMAAYMETHEVDNGLLEQNTHEYLETFKDFHREIPGLDYDSLCMANTLMYWDYRNEIAISRLDSAMKANGSKRALITFGGMHAPPFLQILRENYPEYRVLTIDNI